MFQKMFGITVALIVAIQLQPMKSSAASPQSNDEQEMARQEALHKLQTTFPHLQKPCGKGVMLEPAPTHADEVENERRQCLSLPETLGPLGQQCLQACAEGAASRENFCESLGSIPQLEAICFTFVLGSVVLCEGFCYWYF